MSIIFTITLQHRWWKYHEIGKSLWDGKWTYNTSSWLIDWNAVSKLSIERIHNYQPHVRTPLTSKPCSGDLVCAIAALYCVRFVFTKRKSKNRGAMYALQSTLSSLHSTATHNDQYIAASSYTHELSVVWVCVYERAVICWSLSVAVLCKAPLFLLSYTVQSRERTHKIFRLGPIDGFDFAFQFHSKYHIIISSQTPGVLR